MNSPMLTDERVSSMRSSVMQAVDRDISRRGRRTRRTLGLVAASALVIVTGSVGVSLLGAGGGSDSAGDAMNLSQDDRAGGLTGSAAPEKDSARSVAPQADREVITTGEINMTVKQPSAVAQQLSTYVESLGGRVDSRTQNGRGDDASAFVVVRVPSSQVTQTVDRLKTYGTVDHISLQHQDVTTQAKDLDARIDALRLSVTRLEQIMSESDTSAELIKAETALTQRQEQLESLQAQRKSIADRVTLSTLSIDLSPSAKAGSVQPGGFTGGLTDGWNALVSTVNRVVEIAGVLVPWAAMLLVLYGAYRLIARRRT